MMLESFNTDKFEYKRLTQEEQEKRGILGRLVGRIADTKNPTRNGRLYSNELWEKVFNDPIMQEKINNHLLLGELGHPEDREEIDIEKAAVCLAEPPKKGKDGYLYGVFDILSTPSGKILKSLCDYGCNIAISSRGSGDIIYDDNGNEAVDPDTYQCETFDIVLVPGVEQARLQYVNEALDTKKRNKTLRQRLSEEISKASAEDKKIMKESLANLNIKLNEDTLTEEAAEYVATEAGTGSKIYKVGDEYTATYKGKTVSTDATPEGFDKIVNYLKGEAANEWRRGRDIPENLNESEGYTNAVKAISDGIEDDENPDDVREYLQNIIGYCRSIANDRGVVVESLREKFVEPSKEDLAPIEAKFVELGLEIEKEGKTLFGRKHYQLRKELDHKVTKEDLGPIFDALCDLDSQNLRTTCNVGVHKDGDNIISASVDVDTKYIPDTNEELHGRGRQLFAKAFLDINNEDDLLNYIKEVISYDKALGQSLMKINKEGGSVAYRAKKMSDFLRENLNEELIDTDGWGEEIPMRLEPAFRNLEDLMYEVRNAVRGSVAVNGDEVSDLVQEIRDRAEELEMAADDLEFEQDGLNESIPTDNNKQRELIGKLVRLNQLTDTIISYDKEYDFNTEENKQVVEFLNDTLENIKKLSDELAKFIDTVDENCSDIEVDKEAGNAGAVKELQEALTKSAKLEKDNLSLQEQLSVCNAKEKSLKEELGKCRKALASLTSSAKEVRNLKEELQTQKEQVKSKDELLESTKQKLRDCRSRLVESARANKQEKSQINESVAKASGLEKQIKVLKEQLDAANKKLSSMTLTAKKYKSAFNESKNSYIKAQAQAYGISEDDLRSNIKESYSLSDINKVCEKLSEDKRNMSKLPFRISGNSKLTASSKGDYINGGSFSVDDEISDTLKSFLND